MSKWADLYPSNHALRDLNKRQHRRSFRRTLRRVIRQISPRLDRARMARHDLERWEVVGTVVPRPEPKPRTEFELILLQRSFYRDFEDGAA